MWVMLKVTNVRDFCAEHGITDKARWAEHFPGAVVIGHYNEYGHKRTMWGIHFDNLEAFAKFILSVGDNCVVGAIQDGYRSAYKPEYIHEPDVWLEIYNDYRE